MEANFGSLKSQHNLSVCNNTSGTKMTIKDKSCY